MALGPAFWREALAQGAVPGRGPYGPLSDRPDDNGLFLPEGFRSRIVAVGGELVGETDYRWHSASDGAGTFATAGGGWILTSNSEIGGGRGGASAIEFGPPGGDGTAPVVDAYGLLSGTSRNCAGGETPWGTWLSCEEVTGVGRVWECDPAGHDPAVALDLLGRFSHEAAAVDPRTGQVYLTEDERDSRLFRFTPASPPEAGARPDFASGVLEVLAVGDGGDDIEGRSRWVAVDPGDPGTHRPDATRPFNRNEGIWHHADHVYFCATTRSEVYDLDLASGELSLIYGAPGQPRGALSDADNITVHAPSGDLYVTEDAGNLEVVLLAAGAENREVAAFARVQTHSESEITGPVFDPSGQRLYFASQRGGRGGRAGHGVVYEVTGPFRQESPAADTTTTTTTAATPTTTTTVASAPGVGAAGDGDAGGGSGDADVTIPVAGAAAAAAAVAAAATGATVARNRRRRASPAGSQPTPGDEERSG